MSDIGARPRTLRARGWNVLVVLAPTAFLGSCRSPPEGREEPDRAALTDADVQAIRMLSQDYGKAWLADDTTGVLDLFAPGATLVPHLGNPHVEGRAAIGEHFFPPGQAPVHVLRMDRRSLGVDGGGDVAWERGTYSTTMVFNGDTVLNEGNYVAVARKQLDGRWLWEAYTWNHR